MEPLGRPFRLIRKHYYLLTGILMFFSFPSYDVIFLKLFPFFAWFSLVPLFIYVRDKPFKTVYLSSFLTGALGIFFVYHWIGDFGFRIPGGDVIILIFVIPSLAVVFSGKIIAAEFLSRKHEQLRFIIYPAVWVVVDGIQSIGFLAFPWTYWGYSQYTFTSFIQISSIVGVFGITFLVISGNSILSELYYRLFILKVSHSFRLYRKVILLAAIVILSLVYGFTVLLNAQSCQGKKDIMKIAAVQSCIDPWEDWANNRFEYLEALKALTDRAMEKKPEFIIWSESATLELISFNFERNRLNRFESEVLDVAKRYEVPLLTGEIGVLFDIVHRRLYPQNNAVLINRQGEVIGTYPKINLVPFGEWFPYERWFPWIKRIARSFGGSSFVPGNHPIAFQVNGKRVGPLVCYEGIFFRLCRSYRNLGTDFFVNITNLGWTKTYKGHMQGFANATFRAIENGIWFVSAGNTGFTALVDPCGRITASIPILTPGYLNGEMDFSLNHSTFYAKFGDVVLYLSLMFLLFLIFKEIYTRSRKRFF